MTRPVAGSIVIVDWRGDALPKEPNKRRPAIVVEDDGLFADSYPNVIVVPLTEDPGLALPDLCVPIEPTAENGCPKPCFALPQSIATVSMARVRVTGSRVTDAQLRRIRMLAAEAIGIGSDR